jgi:hypothetical protein
MNGLATLGRVRENSIGMSNMATDFTPMSDPTEKSIMAMITFEVTVKSGDRK